MLIMGHPQFDTQDDVGIGDGIPPIPEWQLEGSDSDAVDAVVPEINDPSVKNVFIRLRNVFQRAKQISLPPERLHDLACFVIHRLLLSASNMKNVPSSPTSECIRYALILYMFLVQGPTYYSHAVILDGIVSRLIHHLNELELTAQVPHSVGVWFLAIGLEASAGTNHYQQVAERARAVAVYLQLDDWDKVLFRIKSILWLETSQSEERVRSAWDAVLNATKEPRIPILTTYVPRSQTGVESA